MSKSIAWLDGKITLYKRERSSVWQARLKLANGKWHRTTTKKHDLEEAKERALEIYYEVKTKAENKIPQVSRRFSNVAKMAIEQMQEELDAGRGKVVYKAYIAALNNLLIPFFGKLNIDNITPKKMTEFENWRREQSDKEPAASTITNHNSALNRVFDLAIQHGWATTNTLPTLRNKGVKSDVRPTFSFEEYDLLIKKLRHWHKKGQTEKSKMMRRLLHDYVLILANTGMRHGTESMNLKWKDIDWYIGKNKKKYLMLTVDGKTGNRQLIARHRVVDYLTRIKNRFNDLKALTLDEIFAQKIDDYVFRLDDGAQTKNIHQTFEKFLADNDLLIGTTSDKPRTLYSLRHFYATYELYRGRSIHQLAKQMGTSVTMLEQHYSKLTPMLIANELAGFDFEEKFGD